MQKYAILNKMKKFVFLISLLISMSATAQTKQGGISASMLQEIEKAQVAVPYAKAIQNAVASNSIDNLVQTPSKRKPIDTHFSLETPKQSIHDQKSSGRCWMFSGLNVLRANFAKKHNDTLRVEFSHDYLFFYDQLEKANLMLQGVIDTAEKPIEAPEVRFFFRSPIGDGGTFCGVADLSAKYGLVPMSIQPETYSAENTSKMRQLISSKLREYGLELRQMVANKAKAKAIQQRKTEMLTTIYSMLSLTLGSPVKQFEYAHVDKNGKQVGEVKTYTPQEFYRECIGEPLNGTFIMVMNDPRHPYYKTYEVEYDRHTYDGTNWKYLNLPMKDIEQLAITALKDGRKMYSSYDVGKQLDRKQGYLDTENYDYGSLFNTTFPMNKAQRIETFDSGSTHAMTLSAVDLDAAGNPVKWKVENSWGASNGQQGCMIMTNRWFEEYMFRLVVDKQYVPAETLAQFNQKPTILLPDDPLFQVED